MGDRTPRMFDMKLKMRADGPGGVPLANNMRFMLTSAHYASGRMAPFHDQPVVPVTKGNGSLAVVLGEPGVRQFFSDNEVFHRAGEGVFTLPADQPFSKMFEAVITANDDDHRRRRRLLMPVVQKTAMDHYREIFIETFAASRFCGKAGTRFDIWREFLDLSKANLLRGLLGLPDTPANRDLADLILTLTQAVVRPDIILFKYDAPWTPYGRWVRRVSAAYERLAALIDKRRGQPQRLDALSIVCNTTDESGDFLTTTEIAGELHGFFSAGFETTALTMTWALLTMLAVPSPSASTPLGLDLTDETVLDAAIKESQRLLPAVPMSLPRRTARDVEIGGTLVPRGSMLFASSIVEHHRASSFPSPYAHRPERWLATGPGPRPHEFFPFGIGARRCLGAAFADLQTRTTLGLLAGRPLQPRLLTRTVDYRMKSGVAAAPRKPVLVELGTPGAPRLPIDGSVTSFWRA